MSSIRTQPRRSSNFGSYASVSNGAPNNMRRAKSTASIAEHKTNLGGGNCACGIGLGLLFIVLLAGVGGLGWYFTQSAYLETFEVVGSIGINVNTRTGVIYAKGENEMHGLKMGGISSGSSLVFSKSCTPGTKELIDRRLPYKCLMYGVDKAIIPEYRLLIQNTLHDVDGFECYDIRWDFPVQHSVRDCLLMSNQTRFYGGGVRKYQTWPSDLQALKSQPLAPDYSNQNNGGYLGIAVPYFVFSSGISLMIDGRNAGGSVSWNESRPNELCFGTPAKDRNPNDLSTQTFSYSVCLGSDITQVHRKSAAKYSTPTKTILDESLIRKPVWNTLAYGIDEFNNLDQDSVQSLASHLLEYDLPASQLLIDPRWEHHPGDDVFNPEYFSEPTGLFAWLKNGPAKMLPVLMMHPFVASTAASYGALAEGRYFVGDKYGNIEKAHWWMGEAAMLDPTNPKSVSFKEDRVKRLLEMQQLSGCRFLGGTSGWITAGNLVISPYWRDLHSGFEAAAKRICGENVQLEIATGLFDRSIVIMPNLNLDNSVSSEEHLARQLQSLIPTALTISLLGHPVFMASPVGGNPFLDFSGKLDFQNAESRFPSTRLYLRWLGVVLFMPVIEFAVPPWFYIDEPYVLEASKRLLDFRYKYTEFLLIVARKAWLSGDPMVRPLWWKFPRDLVAWRVDDQFMVGEGLLVAPIVRVDSDNKRVYLPTGNWTSSQGRLESGPKWIEVTAAIDEVPVFTYG